MNITQTVIPDVLLLEPQVFGDERGFFMETYQRERYRQAGIPSEFAQDNLSRSKKGTLRGLHYQAPDRAQGKLVQVLEGAVLDVAVDIRFGSPTFGQHVAVELSAENHRQLWVPPGFAHGFLVLSPSALFSYKCTEIYSPEHDRGIRYDDPTLGIAWPAVGELLVSEKDRKQPRFADIAREFEYTPTPRLPEVRSAMPQRLLVTGGAGFIGTNFIHYVLGHYPESTVTNLDALTYAGNLANLAALEGNRRYTFIKGNITDAVLVDALVAKADAVVNFAAESHVDRSIMDPGVFVETNIKGTLVLLEAARKYGKRFHQVSTDEVFGALSSFAPPFNEATPYDPRSPYSASKASADHLVRAYVHTFNLPATISNCSNNYGPYHFPEKLIPLAITNILEGKKVPVYGDGRQVRDWLYVEDHCRAIDRVLQHGRLGETYLIGGGNQIDNLTVIRKIAALLGKGDEVIEFVKDRPGHDSRYAIDFYKIRSELGWSPQVNLEKGLEQTVTWFREHPAWWQAIKSGQYRQYYEKQYASTERPVL